MPNNEPVFDPNSWSDIQAVRSQLDRIEKLLQEALDSKTKPEFSSRSDRDPGTYKGDPGNARCLCIISKGQADCPVHPEIEIQGTRYVRCPYGQSHVAHVWLGPLGEDLRCPGSQG